MEGFPGPRLVGACWGRVCLAGADLVSMDRGEEFQIISVWPECLIC